MTDQTEADNEIVETATRAIAHERECLLFCRNPEICSCRRHAEAVIAIVKPMIARQAREKALREAAALVHGRDGFDGKCLVWSYRAYANRKETSLARFAVASSEAILALLDGGDND